MIKSQFLILVSSTHTTFGQIEYVHRASLHFRWISILVWCVVVNMCVCVCVWISWLCTLFDRHFSSIFPKTIAIISQWSKHSISHSWLSSYVRIIEEKITTIYLLKFVSEWKIPSKAQRKTVFELRKHYVFYNNLYIYRLCSLTARLAEEED